MLLAGGPRGGEGARPPARGQPRRCRGQAEFVGRGKFIPSPGVVLLAWGKGVGEQWGCLALSLSQSGV